MIYEAPALELRSILTCFMICQAHGGFDNPSAPPPPSAAAAAAQVITFLHIRSFGFLSFVYNQKLVDGS